MEGGGIRETEEGNESIGEYEGLIEDRKGKKKGRKRYGGREIEDKGERQKKYKERIKRYEDYDKKMDEKRGEARKGQE